LAVFVVLGGLGVFGLSLLFPGVRDQFTTQVLGASAKKADTTGPVVAVAFPAGGVYGPATWTGCSPVGICGSASDDSGVAEVDVTVQQGGNYWNGSAFTSMPKVLVAKGTTSWNLPLPLPAAGSYTVSVTATDKAKPANTGSAAPVTFTVDRTPPSVPEITEYPDNPTLETTATFGYANADTDPPVVTFQCKLDGGAFVPCGSSPSSSATYPNVAMGDHTFSVRALDAVSNPSGPASFDWTVATGSFGITGDLSDTLYPGMAWAPLDLTFTNPYSFTLDISGVQVGVQQTTYSGTTANTGPDACRGPQNVVVDVPAGLTISVPAKSSRSLSGDPGVPIAETLWPRVRMLNTDWNQDTCKTMTFKFTYTGMGTK
jgi:hypothetical protein